MNRGRATKRARYRASSISQFSPCSISLGFFLVQSLLFAVSSSTCEFTSFIILYITLVPFCVSPPLSAVRRSCFFYSSRDKQYELCYVFILSHRSRLIQIFLSITDQKRMLYQSGRRGSNRGSPKRMQSTDTWFRRSKS